MGEGGDLQIQWEHYDPLSPLRTLGTSGKRELRFSHNH